MIKVIVKKKENLLNSELFRLSKPQVEIEKRENSKNLQEN